MSKANGVLRYDAPNRGNILTMLNPAASPSDAVYLERGYVMLYSAWQGDVPKSNPQRLTVDGAGGEEQGRQLDHRALPHRARARRGDAGDVAARRRLQRHDDPVCAGEPGQHAAGYSLTRRVERDRSAHRHSAGRLEVRQLRRGGEPVPRHRRPGEGLPEGRLRSEVPLRAGLRREGPEGDGRRPGGAARHGELLPRRRGRLGRHREPARRAHHACRSARAPRSRATR